jgi:hypothetical protein
MFNKIKSRLSNKATVKVYSSAIKMFTSIKVNLEEKRFIDEDKLTIETTRLSFIKMKDNLVKVYRNNPVKRKNEGEAYDSLVEYCDNILKSYETNDNKLGLEYIERMIEVNRLLLIEAEGLK